MDIINEYNAAAAKFAKSYEVENPHIISIIASVMMTRDGQGIQGGGFVQSVVKNDLFGAVSRADATCERYLTVIVAANQYAHLD